MSSANKYTLKQSLSEKFEGIIWKIETDWKAGIVAIETRNAEKHIATFSAFNFLTGECLFKEVDMPDSWNWGLDCVVEGLVFLHGYVSEKSPEHKGIIVLGNTGAVSWQHFNKSLYAMTEEGPIAYNPSVQPRQYELISIKNGLTLRMATPPLTTVQRNILIPDTFNDLGLKSHLLPPGVIGPIHFISFDDKDFLSFHVTEENTFLQKIMVLQNDKVLLEDFISTNIQKLNPEAFFIEHHHLFYIRNNKQEFVSYLV